LLLLIAVGAAAIGLRALTGPITPAPAAKHESAAPSERSSATPFVLDLSKPAKSVTLETLDGKPLARPDCGTSAVLSGTILLPSDATHIALRVVWQDTSARSHPGFARLTLEAPDKPTISHIFISDRDIDDIWELTSHD
jgi:hypothetical protein